MEAREEIVNSSLRWGCKPLQHAQNKGLLDLDLTAAHMIWVNEKDISDDKNLLDICSNLNINFEKLLKNIDTKTELYESIAGLASKKNVFGSPTYVIGKEIFWVQDRLDLLEEYIIKYNS